MLCNTVDQRDNIINGLSDEKKKTNITEFNTYNSFSESIYILENAYVLYFFVK